MPQSMGPEGTKEKRDNTADPSGGGKPETEPATTSPSLSILIELKIPAGCRWDFDGVGNMRGGGTKIFV